MTRREALRWLGAGAVGTLLPIGCKPAPANLKPMPQRGYVWQRDWNGAVVEAMTEADQRMDGLVVLAGEIVWNHRVARFISASIVWEAMRETRKPIALGLRVAPFGGPFETDDASIRAIRGVVNSLLDEARRHRLELTELQLDFDCAQKKLAGYRVWLQTLRAVIAPVRFVITTLPSWLNESDFIELVREVDGYVLQVHSVPTQAETGRADLCDPTLARRWVERASTIGLPFSVALPTYRCLAGYDSTGKLLGVAMEGPPPAWPPGTSLLDFITNADEVAALVHEWQSEHRPAGLRELIWYRVPIGSDTRNWRWPTLAAVMAGRAPIRKFEVTTAGENPVDITLVNTGESDDEADLGVIVTWDHVSLVSADALPGWTVHVEPNRATFSPSAGARLRLSPGERRGIGWLRHDQIALLHSQVVGRGAAER